MNNKYKIVALFGPAGSGKDYIQKKAIKTIFGKQWLYEIISCTTRPPREGEIDNINYHFITQQHFFDMIKLNGMLEWTVFRKWFYGTPIDSLNKDKINIGVFNIGGIKALLKREDCEVLPIYIHTYDKLRLMRQLVREVNPDCSEICRRFQADEEDFLDIPFSYRVIENNTDEIQPVLNELFDTIREWTNMNI